MNIKLRILLIIVPIIFLLGILLYFNFNSSKQTVLNLIDLEANEIAINRVMEFDVQFESSQKIAEGIATSITALDSIETGDIEAIKKDTKKIIEKTVAKNPTIFGSTVSFLPQFLNGEKFAPYYYREANQIKYKSLDTSDYNYLDQDWFQKMVNEYNENIKNSDDPPKTNSPDSIIINKKGIWSDAYFDEGGGDVLMTTYSSPVEYNNNIIAVATVDISIQNVVDTVKNLKFANEGYGFIITRDGGIIAQPIKAEMLPEHKIKELEKLSGTTKYGKVTSLMSVPKPKSVEMTDPFGDNPAIVMATAIRSTGWTLYLVYPRDKMLEPLLQLRNYNVAVSIFVIILIILVIFWFSSSLSKPITKLVLQTELYADGVWTKKLDENKGPKELRQLARSFNAMGDAIIEQIEKVKTTTAQKERYQLELSIAAEIQQSILPQKFPPFPEMQNKMDLFGTTRPAREIGGDYYDFFQITEDHIAFVIADVSDKGAPSSFFMAMTRMLVREIGERKIAPAEIIRRTNYMLAMDNPHCMFVTLIYGEYNINTGKIIFVNAGHNLPYYINKEGQVTEIKLKRNLPLGIEEFAQYESDEFYLKMGDSLVLYTDGVTEAFNPEGKIMGAEKFEQLLSGLYGVDSKIIVDKTIEMIDDFKGEADQHDDITILCLKRNKVSADQIVETKNKMNEAIFMNLPAKTEMLEKLAIITEAVAKDIGFDDKGIYQITLALDEIVSNVIMHAYPEKNNDTFKIDIIPREDGIYITVTDYGKPFDFDEKVDAYKGEDASIEQEVGGIGLYLARKSTDKLWYEPNTVEGNKMSFIKYL